ncbi:MAG: AMP-binding protein [Pirellulaceae bacterium]
MAQASNLTTEQRQFVESLVVENENGSNGAWMKLVPQLSGQCPVVYREVWERCFSKWDESSIGPRPMWFPGLPEQKNANLSQWMRANRCENYEAFHRWSVDDRNAFWSQAIERLGIKFETPFTEIAGDWNNVENPEWLVDARMNIAASCFSSADDAVAIVSGDSTGALTRWSYAELKQRTLAVAGAIRAAGFEPGDALAVVLPMTADAVAIYLGIVWAGCSVVSIADSFAAREIANRLRIANAKAVFTYDHMVRGGKKLELFSRVAEATELPAIVLSCGDAIEVTLRSQDFAWDSFLESSNNADTRMHVAAPNDCINILFSSGTTGDPKAIPWTHTTPIKCAIDGYCHQDIRPGHVCCWPTNLGWMMGPYLIFASLINRGTIALYEDVPVGPGFGRFVQDAKVNMLGVIPTLVRSWRGAGDLEAFDWSNIHVFSSTGESSQPADMFYLSALAGMRPVIEYCGGTEIGGGYITSTVLTPNVPSMFSTAAVGLDFVLLNEQGLEEGEGEVFLIPPSIGLSTSLLNRDHHETYYAGTPDVANRTPLRRHGDFIQRFESTLGCHFYTAGGRVDDTMNLGGIKVSSAELERVMNGSHGVRETAAIALAEGGGPERLHVFVVMADKRDAAELVADFNQRLRTELNPLFRVSEIHVVDSLPRTASNKVMRRSLRDLLKVK